MKKRCLTLLMALALSVGTLVGCGNSSGTNEGATSKTEEPVKITFYSTQAGVDNETVEVLNGFMNENPNIKVEYIPCGDDQLQAWQGLYASGEAPTVALLDTTLTQAYSSYFYNFSEHDVPWLEDVISGQEYYTVDGSLYAVPASIQGFGLMYNNRVLKEIFGDDFDIKTINTRDKLEQMLADIEASGKAAPTVMLNADWALAAHLGSLLYSGYQGDAKEQQAFIEGLRNGDVLLVDNTVYNDLIDTLDLLEKYNLNKDDPLKIMQEIDCENFATGKAATFFQGDWQWVMMGSLEDKDEELGIIPLPISNDPDKNVGLPMSSPKGYCIDASQNTEEQQAAGLKLVEYLCMSQTGQEFMGVTIGSTLPYANVKVENPNVLARSTKEYMEKGEVLDIFTYVTKCPSDYFYVVGPYFQQYVAGEIDRQQLAQEIESYWKNVK